MCEIARTILLVLAGMIIPCLLGVFFVVILFKPLREIEKEIELLKEILDKLDKEGE